MRNKSLIFVTLFFCTSILWYKSSSIAHATARYATKIIDKNGKLHEHAWNYAVDKDLAHGTLKDMQKPEFVADRHNLRQFYNLIEDINKDSFVFNPSDSFINNLKNVHEYYQEKSNIDTREHLFELDIYVEDFPSLMMIFKILYINVLSDDVILDSIYPHYQKVLKWFNKSSKYEERDYVTIRDKIGRLFSSSSLNVLNNQQIYDMFSEPHLCSHISRFNFSQVDPNFSLANCPEIRHKCDFNFSFSYRSLVNEKAYVGLEKFTGLRSLYLTMAFRPKNYKYIFNNLPKSLEFLCLYDFEVTDDDLKTISNSNISVLNLTHLNGFTNYDFISKMKNIKTLRLWVVRNVNSQIIFNQYFSKLESLIKHEIKIKINSRVFLLKPTVIN